jgi:hypothetical protein
MLFLLYFANDLFGAAPNSGGKNSEDGFRLSPE